VTDYYPAADRGMPPRLQRRECRVILTAVVLAGVQRNAGIGAGVPPRAPRELRRAAWIAPGSAVSTAARCRSSR